VRLLKQPDPGNGGLFILHGSSRLLSRALENWLWYTQAAETGVAQAPPGEQSRSLRIIVVAAPRWSWREILSIQRWSWVEMCAIIQQSYTP
jgi:hypothetical protein